MKKILLVVALLLSGCYDSSQEATVIWVVHDESCLPSNVMTTLRINETNQVTEVCGWFGDVGYIFNYER